VPGKNSVFISSNNIINLLSFPSVVVVNVVLKLKYLHISLHFIPNVLCYIFV